MDTGLADGQPLQAWAGGTSRQEVHSMKRHTQTGATATSHTPKYIVVNATGTHYAGKTPGEAVGKREDARVFNYHDNADAIAKILTLFSGEAWTAKEVETA